MQTRQRTSHCVFEPLEVRQLLAAAASKALLAFNETTASGASAAQSITITNTGSSSFSLPSDGIAITGTDSSHFGITSKPSLPTTVAPGASISISLNYTTSSAGTINSADLHIKTSDATTPTLDVPLRGLGTSGTGGTNEPSLQRILDLWNIPVDVGDSNPGDVYLDNPPVTPNDELVMSQLQKAGSGAVTIEALASFGVGSSSLPTTRLGYYTPGNRFDRTELFTISGTASSQSVNPNLNGATAFDPGSKAFGIYALWPSMATISGAPAGGTETYSEDRLNQAYDSKSPRKVRFYPLKTSSGAVVANAYVFAFEEFNAGYDNQDFVGIIRNVKAAPSGAEIGFENADGVPFSDRLVFNRIQIQPPKTKTDPTTGVITQPPNNVVDDVATIIVRNTGTSSLNVSSITVPAGWQLENSPTSFTLAPNGTQSISIRFIATAGPVKTGTLVFNSNDADEPAASVQLAGYWEKYSEEVEPKLYQVVQVFGYSTAITYGSQVLNEGGLVDAVGDEVLAGLWKRADSSTSVNIRQLAAFHTQGNSATLYYYTVNSTGTVQKTAMFTMEGVEAQSLLPHVAGSTSQFAQGSFSPSGTFGLRIDNEYSEDSRNVQEQAGGNYGHHVRFFVLKDRAGNVVPNQYLMVMDYQGINYDYNDNVYLVSNIKPADRIATPIDLVAVPSASNIKLDWAANTDGAAGYNVYRATSAGGTYTKLNGSLLSGSSFTDSGAPTGIVSYYKVTAVDANGVESVYAGTNAARGGVDITPPAMPTGVTISAAVPGITLDWANNSESDLAGYNVYRATTSGGTYTKINSSLLTSSNYFDSTAKAGAASYYHITAVDKSGNESAAASANATRPLPDTTPPVAPSAITSTTSSAGVALDWADNIESDLAGYNIYRSDADGGTYTKINSTLVTSSNFLDATALPNVGNYYRITAVDKTGNESAATNAAAIGPDTIAPANVKTLSAVHNNVAIILDWADNTETDLAGYNVYRSDSGADGTFVKLTATPLAASTFTDKSATKGATSYYRVVAVDTSGNESAAASVNHFRPYTYASYDLRGAAVGTTSTVALGSAYDVAGSGDIGVGHKDACRFVYRMITGDFDVRVRVASLGVTNGAEKAGLMIRETLANDSRMLAAYVNAKSYRMSYRSETSADAIGTGTGAATFPNNWIRLRRVGDTFTSYRSVDGVTWTKLGTVTMALPKTLYFGMAVSSYSATTLATAKFRNLSP